MAQWRITPTGERQWQGADGNWYGTRSLAETGGAKPPPKMLYVPSHKKHSPLKWAVAIVAIIVAVLCGLLLTTRFLRPSGPSNSQLDARVLSQARGHFDLRSAESASCVMPSSWASGQTFTCYVYASSGDQLAEMNGTVLPSKGDRWLWSGIWAR